MLSRTSGRKLTASLRRGAPVSRRRKVITGAGVIATAGGLAASIAFSPMASAAPLVGPNGNDHVFKVHVAGAPLWKADMQLHNPDGSIAYTWKSNNSFFGWQSGGGAEWWFRGPGDAYITVNVIGNSDVSGSNDGQQSAAFYLSDFSKICVKVGPGGTLGKIFAGPNC